MTDDELFAANGVLTLARGDGEPIRHGGWMPTPFGCAPPNVSEFTPFSDPAPIAENEVFLWEALYRVCGDKYPPFRWQLTGSCVEGGYNNNLKILMGQEIANLPQPEAYVTPFTFHTYGLSRYLGFGATSEGEGSFGMSMAQAGSEGGVSFVDDPDASRPHVCGPAEVYDAPVELKWSSVRNHPPGLVSRSKKYTVKFVRCRTVDQAEEHLRRRHPLTWAGDWGGQSSGVTRGTQFPVLFMPRRETWNHQQSCWGVWRHPELSRLWYIQNQWWAPGTTKYQLSGRSIWKITQPGEARPMHGEHPAIPGWTRPPLPRGGYWVDDATMEYQCRTGEVCATVLFDGATGREIGLGNI